MKLAERIYAAHEVLGRLAEKRRGQGMTTGIDWHRELAYKGWCHRPGAYEATLDFDNEDNVLVYDVASNRWYILADHDGCGTTQIYIPGPQTVEELDLLVRMLGGKK